MPKNEDENDDNNSDDNNDNNDNDNDGNNNNNGDGASSNGLKGYIQEKTRGLTGMRRWLDAVGNNCAIYYVKWYQHGCKEEWQWKTAYGF